MLQVMAKSVLGVGGQNLGHKVSIWRFQGPLLAPFGALEAPVAAYWDLLGPHCNHVKGGGDFKSILGPVWVPQCTPNLSKSDP